MTTEHRPAPGRTPAGPASGTRGILLRAGAVAVLAAVLTGAVGLVVAGSPGGLGGLFGGLLVVVVLGTGSLAVDAMARRSAVQAMLTALVTFFGQAILLVGLLFLLVRGDVVGDELAPAWLAAGVVATALTWTAAQIRVARQARIPLYHLPGHGG